MIKKENKKIIIGIVFGMLMYTTIMCVFEYFSYESFNLKYQLFNSIVMLLSMCTIGVLSWRK